MNVALEFLSVVLKIMAFLSFIVIMLLWFSIPPFLLHRLRMKRLNTTSGPCWKHNCPINEQTADGKIVGRCWFALKDGKICPRHGDVHLEALHFASTGKLTIENDMRRRKNLPNAWMLGCTKTTMKQVIFNNTPGWPLHKEGKRSFIWFRGYKLYGGTEKHSPDIFVPDLVECGSCGCYHPADFFGDCRDDDHRFASEFVWRD